jgi:hypothetical protein
MSHQQFSKILSQKFHISIKSFVWFIILTVFLFRCSDSSSSRLDSNKISKVLMYNVKEDLESTIKLKLDSITKFGTNCLQYYNDKKGGKDYLAFLNKLNNSIYVYNYPEGDYSFRIHLATEGPNSFGNAITGFKIISLDSIIVVGRYLFSITDTTGVPYYKYSFQHSNQVSFTAMPEAATTQPIIKKSNILFFSTAIDKTPFSVKNFLDDQCKIVFDLTTNTYKYDFKYPDLYRKNTYGYNHMSFYHAFNDSTEKFVYSFPVDPNIYEVDHFGSIKSYYAGSTLISRKTEPMPSDFREFEQYTKHYLLNSNYSYIYYDPFRKLYYRVIEDGISEDDYKQRKWWKKKALIVLDAKFNVIAEGFLDDYLAMNMGFITKDGFFVAKSNLNDKEDYMTFVKLSIINKDDI